jgi:hypothetical protein
MVGALTGQVWQITVPVGLRWRFSSTTGGTISEVAFPESSPFPLLLSYTPIHCWQIAQQNTVLQASPSDLLIPAIVCGAGNQVLDSGLAGAAQTLRITSLDLGVAGCLMVTEQSQANQEQIIWRFGVLLAADAKTHALLPALPLASPGDIAALGQ